MNEWDRAPEGRINGVWDGHQRGEDRFDGTLGQRGVKRNSWEGGLNVPFLIRWPGRTTPGSESDLRFAVQDIMPTLAEIMQVEIPVAIDGISFAPTLLNRDDQKTSDYLFWINTTGAARETIIAGDWKLIYELDMETSDVKAGRRNYRPALYHLKDDPFEKNDLVAMYPDKVLELAALVKKAKLPLP